ncbi:3'-5' exoribonuclease YhaM family protein [Edaphobacter modestus]|uniref:3'-5' exoribonuclease n=1 Tax=Edaphobacter modestus TaxID=388466 RepID=A0A4Q7YRI4_9BACT|nr:HD domain-containing protein [Edaphobacter modestus]RZU40110.1 3'-5' exoribonuclease [Edaphobacter modestus]
MKDFFIADAPRFDNAFVTSYFVLSSLQVRERRQGGQFLTITLTDKTGSMPAVMWEDFADSIAVCSEGCYVKAQGQVTRYQNKFQMALQRLRFAAETEIDPTDYLPITRFDIDEMWDELRGYVLRFTNPDLRRLVFAFLDEPAIASAYRMAPAAKVLHHAWIGGLLEHVVTLVRVCVATAPFYPEVDPDLLVTGAILHDVGKIRELHWKSSFGYTLEGQLIGHISIAQGMLIEKVRELEPFPERLRLLVEHMILSHHGKYEFGSPKLPMTPEALLLNMLDDLEAKMQTLRNAFANAEVQGKRPGEVTDWIRSMDRPLFNSSAYLNERPASGASPAIDASGASSAVEQRSFLDAVEDNQPAVEVPEQPID